MAGALDDLSDIDFLSQLQDSQAQQGSAPAVNPNDFGALPAPKESIDPADVETRKQIFNNATQRLLAMRDAMQRPYNGANLGMLAFGSEMVKPQRAPGEAYANAALAKARAGEEQRQADIGYLGQQQGLDMRAAISKILASPTMGDEDKIQSMYQLSLLSGDDKGAQTSAQMLRAMHTGVAGRAISVLNEKGEPELTTAQDAVKRHLAPIMKDAYGNILNKTPGTSEGGANVPSESSADPQDAAKQILEEDGIPYTPVSPKDITARNKQIDAYKLASSAYKDAINSLNSMQEQTGKYVPGSMNAWAYNKLAAAGQGGPETSARTIAEKEAKNLANAFMKANVGARGSGIRMVEFDANAVPNADMPDEARTKLIQDRAADANLQIERGIISDMYPRLSTSNVNAIMDNYESKNPTRLPDGSANTNWLPYKEWLKKGRPNTALETVEGDQGGGEPKIDYKTPEEIRAAYKAKKLSREEAKKLLTDHGFK